MAYFVRPFSIDNWADELQVEASAYKLSAKLTSNFTSNSYYQQSGWLFNAQTGLAHHDEVLETATFANLLAAIAGLAKAAAPRLIHDRFPCQVLWFKKAVLISTQEYPSAPVALASLVSDFLSFQLDDSSLPLTLNFMNHYCSHPGCAAQNVQRFKLLQELVGGSLVPSNGASRLFCKEHQQRGVSISGICEDCDNNYQLAD